MRVRPSARLLVVDPEGRLLLFRVDYRRGPMAGEGFWATPGGALDPGETFEQAAVRELFEETGFRIDHPGPEVWRREIVFQTVHGETVLGHERFFRVAVEGLDPATEGWTELEREVMSVHRWWALDALRTSDERFWPENVADLLAGTQ
jgi:8-oxo-dGTP pyrophosphatase MutT (NUDIX family)